MAVTGRAWQQPRVFKFVLLFLQEFGRLAFEAWKRSLLDDGQEDFAT